MDTISQDVRFGIRQVRRTPMVSLFIVATLAVGIGATAAIFSAVDTMLLRPIYANEHQLVTLNGAYRNRGDDWSVSLPNAADWASRSHSFSGLAWYQRASMTLNEAGSPDRIHVITTTPNLFRVLDVTPLIGRLIADENALPDGERVVVLSHGLWQTRFAGDKSVVGKPIQMNGRPATVIGVMRPEFAFPSSDIGAYMALRATPSTWARSNGGLSVIARMRPGVDVAAAQRDLGDVSRRLEAEYPGDNKDLSAKVRPFRNALVGPDLTKALYFLAGAVMLVLLIACVNVANLLLARATEREREIAVRAALGAGRTRVVRQLLTEGLVLAFLGGAGGVGIAALSVRLFPAMIPPDVELPRGFALDWRVVVFGLAVTMLTGIAFSVLPALKATATDLTALMGVRAARGGRRQRDRRSALVILEVALAVILLVSTGLAIAGLGRLLQTNPGFRPEHLLTARIPLDGPYRDSTQARLFAERLLAEIRSTPAVEAASFVDFAPLSGTNNFNDLTIEGGDPAKPVNVGTIMAGPGYLEAMGIPLVKGREFSETDRKESGMVVILNKTLADQLFPDRDPIGQRVAWTGDVLRFIGVSDEWRTVVGVVGNTKDGGLDAEPRGIVFQPLEQEQLFGGGLVIRAQRDPASLIPAATRLVRSIVPNDPIENVLTIPQIKDQSVAPRRLNAVLVSSFGVLAVIIAAVGIAGVLAFSVSARTNEIGIRMSLGADSARVQRMVLAEGGILLVYGLLLGVVGALIGTRLMRGLLFGVTPNDPLTLVGVAAMMVVVGIAACWLPALRAAKIDPAVAIRRQ